MGRQQLLGESIPTAHGLPLAPDYVQIAGPTRVDKVAWPRLPLVLISLVTLMLGLGGGLVRMGINLPPADSAARHGVFMVIGFLGTLIAVERAVALDHYWGWIGPIALAIGALGLWFSISTLFVTGAIVGSTVFTIVALRIWQIQPGLHTLTMALGAGALPASIGLMATGRTVPELVPWWTVFLVGTIAGERLELSKFSGSQRGSRWSFAVSLALLMGGALVSLGNLSLASRLLGTGLIALASWLLRYDIAMNRIRAGGLPGFSAIALVSGYAWLIVAGALWLWKGALYAGFTYDAVLHCLLVGFVFSMIFAHAPIVFPAVLRLRLSFYQGLYLPLAQLHGSLLVRLAGDLVGMAVLRQIGGILSTVSILGFFAALQAGRFVIGES